MQNFNINHCPICSHLLKKDQVAISVRIYLSCKEEGHFYGVDIFNELIERVKVRIDNLIVIVYPQKKFSRILLTENTEVVQINEIIELDLFDIYEFKKKIKLYLTLS